MGRIKSSWRTVALLFPPSIAKCVVAAKLGRLYFLGRRLRYRSIYVIFSPCSDTGIVVATKYPKSRLVTKIIMSVRCSVIYYCINIS